MLNAARRVRNLEPVIKNRTFLLHVFRRAAAVGRTLFGGYGGNARVPRLGDTDDAQFHRRQSFPGFSGGGDSDFQFCFGDAEPQSHLTPGRHAGWRRRVVAAGRAGGERSCMRGR